jgi:uncharacterized protein YlaI
MPDFETYTCPECSEQFAAHPSARAADGYCSPRFEATGKGLT